MRPQLVQLAIEVAIKADVPIWIHGIAGVGKSEMVEETAERLGYYVIDLRLATQEVVDLIGRVVDKIINDEELDDELVSTWSMPFWMYDLHQKWKDGIPTVIFLDEMNRAAADVIQASYQLVLKKQLHMHKAPGSCRIVVAGNPPTMDYDVDTVDDSMTTRYVHVQADSDAEQWLTDYGTKHCHPDICNFIAASKLSLCEKPEGEFDAVSLGKARPRTWTFASKVHMVLLEMGLEKSNPDFCHLMLGGLVGLGPAKEFLSSLKDGWYTMEDVLTGNVKWDDINNKKSADIRIIHQLALLLTYSAVKDKERSNNLVQFVVDASNGGKKDLILGLMKSIYRNPDPKLTNWLLEMEEFDDLMEEITEAMG